MTNEQVIEIIERYKLRIPPTVYYDLLADVQELEEEEEPTTKNDLGVDCIKKSDAINIIQDMHGLARADVISDAVNRIITMPSVTPQEPILDELRAEITTLQNRCYALTKGTMCAFCRYECEYKPESEG